MATYKLIQDIEAEDHILGPLTLRQFIFALIGVFFYYMSFLAATKGGSFLLVATLPPALFCTFFALPLGGEQSTEIWALAKLRFLFKPRVRVWCQSGVKELVTINVPKKIERVLTNGLSQTEVKGRLQALADTIDSRGWAVKHIDTYGLPQAGNSDRLIDLSTMPQEVPADDVTASDDILDEVSSPIAQQFDDMITQSSQTRRQELIAKLNQPAPVPAAPITQTRLAPPTTAQPQDSYWFMGQGHAAVPGLPAAAPAIVAPIASDETMLATQLKSRAAAHPAPYGHMRTMQPLSAAPSPVAAAVVDEPPEVTAPADAAILTLANNDDLDVATLAREAKRTRDSKDRAQNEVVISLH